MLNRGSFKNHCDGDVWEDKGGSMSSGFSLGAGLPSTQVINTLINSSAHIALKKKKKHKERMV